VKRAATGLLAEVSLRQGGVLRPHLWAEPTAAAATGDASASLCTCTVNGGDYRGPLNTTVSGFACQPWADVYPVSHAFTPERHPNAGLDGGHNACRNPDGEASAWCFTIQSSYRWERCAVPRCAPERCDPTGA